MKKLSILTFVIAFSLVFNNSYAQEVKAKKKKPPYRKSTLFKSDDIVNLKLLTDNKVLLKDIGDERKYHKTIFEYYSPKQNLKNKKLKVKTRGHFRRNPQNCNMPPLKIKISKKVRKSKNIFSGHHQLKLVVPCQKNLAKYQEYVMLEYLVYKTYNLLTDSSFKVRLVNIELIDTINSKKSLEMKGFFIEETKQLAYRLNAKKGKMERFHQENVSREQMTLLAVFQYMVGNTDWSVNVGHNIKLLYVNMDNKPIAVPYDFDWSGMVNAPYAVPAPQLGINSVRERLYRGYEREIEEFEPIVKLFNQKKDEIYDLYNNFEWLSERSKKTALKYLDDFYKTINNPKKLKREFIDNCRKMQ